VDGRRLARAPALDRHRRIADQRRRRRLRPPVVFSTASRTWQNSLETIPAIARDHRVIVLDLPGMGTMTR
jgi:hypothetical protein